MIRIAKTTAKISHFLLKGYRKRQTDRQHETDRQTVGRTDGQINNLYLSSIKIKAQKLVGQGPKLTFLGRRQLPAEIFFSVAIWKNVVAKKCQ